MKILIVDDSETLRVQLRKDLEGAGYTVIEGADGLLGLETLSQNPDTRLIICDVNMPRMDGLTMCTKVRETNKTLPILMMTTESSPEMKAKGKEAGVLAWVTKPYSADKLIAVVKKIVQ